MTHAAATDPTVLRLARRWSDDPAARVLASVRCAPFDRADPLWTNPARSPADARFHCPAAAAAPLLRPRWDGRNRCALRHAAEVAVLPDAVAGFDGLVARGRRLFAFGRRSAAMDALGYLASLHGEAPDAAGRRVRLPGLEALAPGTDAYYEWRRVDDPAALGRLEAIYHAARRETAQVEGGVRVSRHDKLAVLLSRRSYVYYYHLTHVLPLLCLLRPLLLEDPEIRVLAAGPFAEHFALLGIGPERLVAYDPGTLYRARRLYAATPVPVLLPPRELLAGVRRAFAPQTPAGPPCVVVIRRTPGQRTAFRNGVCERLGVGVRVDVCMLENHDEVLEAVRAAFPGEEVVDFDSDRWTPAAQVALFARARVVVGAHGSGLANLVFAPAGARVLELMPERSFFPLFWHLAQALGHRYAVHVVPGVSKYDNFRVPPAEVTAALERLAD
ncbi:MAG TPA: glycosyltransferase family 61 protein [Longimicrobiaceae bacterium]|nr:glycosyltransferase family 61 protein [Longimicrobiaceae bacterium]